MITKLSKICRANGPRRVRSSKPPVFAYYCTIIFDNMAPPWGVGWRKCDRRSSVEVPSKFRRCFQRGPKNEPKNHWFFDAFLAPFGLHLASILGPFWNDFPLQFWDPFSMWFFLIWASFVITPALDFGALAYTPCDFSSFRHVATSTKKTPKYP